MSRPHRRTVALFAVLTGAALAVTACGSSAVAPAPAAASTSVTAVSAGDTAAGGNTSATGDTAAVGNTPATRDIPAATGVPGDSSDPAGTVALPMSVRVVNLYLPKGSDTPSPIEVWSGPPADGGKKLTTVPYGQASAYFAPQVSNPGQGASGAGVEYSLSLYAAGHLATDDELISQNERSAPGEKLTMVATPGDPDSTGATLQVLTDDLGSAPQGSGFTTVSLPPPSSGTAVLSINATALQYRNGGSGVSLTASTTAGKCLAYLDPDTGKVHDMSSDTTDMIGGTGSLAYPLSPGASFRLDEPKDQESLSDACAGPPLAGPFAPGLIAGQRAYGFLYGINLKSAKLLVVPVS